MRPQKLTPLALSSLLILTTSLPADAQRQRQRINPRGGTVTVTGEGSRLENGGFSGTRTRVREGASGGSAEVNSEFETDGQGSVTGVRDRVITGPQGNTATCSSTITATQGSGYESSGSCN